MVLVYKAVSSLEKGPDFLSLTALRAAVSVCLTTPTLCPAATSLHTYNQLRDTMEREEDCIPPQMYMQSVYRNTGYHEIVVRIALNV